MSSRHREGILQDVGGTAMRILKIDIETAPAKAYIWDLKTRYVPITQVDEDGYVLCFAYQWVGEEDTYFWSRWDQGEEAMVQAAWDLLDEADAIIHYNGNKFDIPRLNTEFLRYRLGPPAPSAQIDLYQTVSRKFKVLSRSMNHMLHILSLESKMEHKGMALWTGVMEGNKADQQIMEEYNIQDVEVMQDLYEELLPWIDNHPNMALWMEPGKDPICPNCASTDLRFKGYQYNRTLSYKRYHCNSCGFHPRERFARETGKNRRREVLT
jgi:DNA polymerase elongation subunit (family B)/predicted RNA-binding Zn-ribbon protein involved in translation (DUF1610 family)